MNLTYFRLSVALAFCVLLFSCSQELQESSTPIETSKKIEETSQLAREATQWKTTPISQELVQNQRNISHYQFEVNELKTLIYNSAVNYV